MKKLLILHILFLSLVSKSFAQEYEFINEVIANKKSDTIYLKNKFLDLNTKIPIEYFDKGNLRELWYPLPNPNTPPIELFFKNFSLEHLQFDLLKNQKKLVIDFEKLDKRLKSSTDIDMVNHRKRSYVTISKPIFNCSKDWAVIVKSSYMPYANAGGAGYMYIYVKIKNKWILYYKFDLWFT